MVPAVPPEIEFAVNHSGGDGTSSIGVALKGHDIGSPIEPSAYSVTIAARYLLPSTSVDIIPL